MSILNTNDLFIEEFIKQAQFLGVNYDCIPTELSSEEKYTKFGSIDDIDLTLCFKVADFSTLPAKGGVITFSGIEYRIEGRKIDSDDSTFDLALTGKYE